MSKKHYVALAKAYADYRNQKLGPLKRNGVSVTAHNVFDDIVRVTADIMAHDNARFDRYRFIKAVYDIQTMKSSSI